MSRREAFRRARYAERHTRGGVLVHPHAPHGTTGAFYNWGCQCIECYKAATESEVLQLIAEREEAAHATVMEACDQARRAENARSAEQIAKIQVAAAKQRKKAAKRGRAIRKARVDRARIRAAMLCDVSPDRAEDVMRSLERDLRTTAFGLGVDIGVEFNWLEAEIGKRRWDEVDSEQWVKHSDDAVEVTLFGCRATLLAETSGSYPDGWLWYVCRANASAKMAEGCVDTKLEAYCMARSTIVKITTPFARDNGLRAWPMS
jgi:hypothetical protein